MKYSLRELVLLGRERSRIQDNAGFSFSFEGGEDTFKSGHTV